MKFYAATDIGAVRSENQDNVYASKEPVGMLPNLFLVADGMGGENGGRYASQYAVDKILDAVMADGRINPVELMSSSLRSANTSLNIQRKKNPEFCRMGTTVCMACLVGSVLYVANVGDSRLYLLRDNLIQVTRDHSIVEELIARGQMVRGSAEYYRNKNKITKAIGCFDTVEPDYFELDLIPGDKFLLCSDGLTNMVNDDRIKEIISSDEDPETLVTELIRLGNANGGMDNISVILVDPELSEVDTWC